MPQGFLRSYSSEKRRRHDVFRCLGTSRQTGTPHFAHPRALSALTWSGARAEIDLFGSDRLHFVSASYAVELVAREGCSTSDLLGACALGSSLVRVHLAMLHHLSFGQIGRASCRERV